MTLTDKDELIREFAGVARLAKSYYEKALVGRMIYIARNAPAVERKHGTWTRITPAGIYECSECGKVFIPANIDAHNFCFNCGARMTKGDEG